MVKKQNIYLIFLVTFLYVIYFIFIEKLLSKNHNHNLFLDRSIINVFFHIKISSLLLFFLPFTFFHSFSLSPFIRSSINIVIWISLFDIIGNHWLIIINKFKWTKKNQQFFQSSTANNKIWRISFDKLIIFSFFLLLMIFILTNQRFQPINHQTKWNLTSSSLHKLLI